MEYQKGQMSQCLSEWNNVQYSQQEAVPGRCRHTSLIFNNKIITFGGCFMYNRKRQQRECTNQLIIYDIKKNCY